MATTKPQTNSGTIASENERSGWQDAKNEAPAFAEAICRRVARTSTRFGVKMSACRNRLPSERQLIAIGIDRVEIAHAIVTVLRRVDQVGSPRDQIGVYTVDVRHEHADAAVARQPPGLAGCEKVQGNLVPAQTRIGGWGSILKSDREAERV